MKQLDWQSIKKTLREWKFRFELDVWLPIRPWLKNSGASVTFIVNPWNWRLKPWAENAATSWETGPSYKGVVFGWLFLIVKVWIDNDDY